MRIVEKTMEMLTGRNGNFPTLFIMLIALGIALYFIFGGVATYISHGEELIKNIPEMESFAANDLVEVPATEHYAVYIDGCEKGTIVTITYDTSFAERLITGEVQQLAFLNVYFFDEQNYTIWAAGGEAPYLAKEVDAVGVLIGTTVSNGTHVVVFDNSYKDTVWEVPTQVLRTDKMCNYNIRAVIPSKTQIEHQEGQMELKQTIFYPSYAVIAVGILGMGYWAVTTVVFYRKRKGATVS